MESRTSPLPPLDVHAHIATDVTSAQVRRLAGSVVFAVTRTVSEARSAPHGTYPYLVWGAGCHPADKDAVANFQPERFTSLIDRFALIGEVGLDRRAGNLPAQDAVFSQILELCEQQPVMLSIHSAGCTADVVRHLHTQRLPGAILHWFTGTPQETTSAAEAGAWFSVNSSTRDDLIAAMPPERVLTETDFPFTRKSGATRPGDTLSVETKLAGLWQLDPGHVRRTIWANFATLATTSGAGNRLPPRVADILSQIA